MPATRGKLWLVGRVEFVRDAVEGWSRLRQATDVSSLGTVQRLIWSGRLAEDILERAATGAGLSRRGDYEVLALLRRSEPELLGVLDVAQRLRASQSGVTGKIDRLEDRGLVERRPDSNDGRAVRLQLTDDGRSLVEAAFTASLELYDDLMIALDDTERDRLDELLDALLERLDELANGKPSRNAAPPRRTA